MSFNVLNDLDRLPASDKEDLRQVIDDTHYPAFNVSVATEV